MTTPSGHPVMIVMDPGDDVHCVTAAWGAHDPSAGVITVHPTPGTTRIEHMCLDVLNALDKPIDQAPGLSGAGGRQAHIEHAARAWISAEGVWHIIVLRAHLLTRPQRAWLITFAADAGAVLTVVWHANEPADWSAEMPGQRGWTVMPSLHQALVAARLTRKPWRAVPPARSVLHCAGGEQVPSPHEEHAADTVALPPLPGSDFPSFRADSFRTLRLSPDPAVAAVFGDSAFDAVDAVYGYGMDMACTWILEQDQAAAAESAPRARDRQGARPSAAAHLDRLQRFLAGIDPPITSARRPSPSIAPAEESPYPQRAGNARGLRLFLADLVADCPTRGHAIARIRGAQAGFFAHGLLLAVPPLLDRATGRGLVTQLDAEQADRIRSHVLHPVHAAALAAVLCTGADPADVAAAAAHACSPDGAFLHLAESPLQGFVREPVSYGVPSYARSLLRAARHYHTLCGYDAAAPLLADGIGRECRQLIATARLCAMPIPTVLAGRQGDLPWDLRTTCWRVGEPLHRAGQRSPQGRESAEEGQH
ncbi:hypothetical protein [Nonomuraea sp. NPDC048916]|uniref:hypothetical protein n=1 Tax=Nonomuraea sp. NPDC048916 TaxID=3154232 RepID=UPI0033E4D68B